MTVFPQPKAPGMAVVPPCTHLDPAMNEVQNDDGERAVHTGRERPEYADQLAEGNPQYASQRPDGAHGQARLASWYAP